MSKEATIRAQYITTAFLGFILNSLSLKIVTEYSIHNSYLYLVLSVFPYFIKCIFIPFAIMSVIRFVIKPIYEYRIFNIFAIIYFIAVITKLSQSSAGDIAVYYAISSITGTFTAFFLHTLFNAKSDKNYNTTKTNSV